MSGIFGIFYRDGAAVTSATIGSMQQAMTHWGRDGADVRHEGCVGMGPLPFMESGILFTADGRVDNREELIADCGLRITEYEKSGIPDSQLILHAYRKWGEDCPKRIYGDWSFAVWQPRERRLFLARDHFGH